MVWSFTPINRFALSRLDLRYVVDPYRFDHGLSCGQQQLLEDGESPTDMQGLHLWQVHLIRVSSTAGASHYSWNMTARHGTRLRCISAGM